MNEATVQDVSEKKSGVSVKMIVMIVVMAVIAAACGLFIILNLTSNTIHPYDYMTTPVFTGYNGYGTLSYNSGENKNSENTFVEYMTRYRAGDLKFKAEHEEAGNRWLEDNGYPTLMDLVLSYLMEDYQVDVLSQVNGIIDQVNPTVRWFDSYAIDTEPYTNLSNGDKVTLSWTFNGKEDEFRVLEQCIDGKIDTSDIIVTVSGLDETQHVSAPSDIKDSFIAQLREMCESDFADYVSDEWDPSEQILLSYDYNGYVLITTDTVSENELFLFYRGLSSETGNGVMETTEFWNYYRFDNVDRLTNGTNYTDTSHLNSAYGWYQSSNKLVMMWYSNQSFRAEAGNVSFAVPGYGTADEMYKDQLSLYAGQCDFWYVDANGNVDFVGSGA